MSAKKKSVPPTTRNSKRAGLIAGVNAPLNDKQRRFCEFVAIETYSFTQAYKAAFPTCKSMITAQQEGCKLAKKPLAIEMIADLRLQVKQRDAARRFLSRDRAREILARIATVPLTEINDKENADLLESMETVHEEGEDDMPLIVRKFVGPKVKDRIRAIELDGKIAGYLRETPAPDGTPVGIILGKVTLQQIELYRKISECKGKPPQELLDQLDVLHGRNPGNIIELQ